MYEDKTLVCKECGKEFVFTAGEQEFYAERGFQNEPQRCKSCRDARKNAARGPREFFTATCAACGGEAKCPSSPSPTVPCTAATASPVCASRANSQLEKGRPQGASFFLSADVREKKTVS